MRGLRRPLGRGRPLSRLRVQVQHPRARLARLAAGAALLHRDRAGHRGSTTAPTRPRPRRRPAWPSWVSASTRWKSSPTCRCWPPRSRACRSLSATGSRGPTPCRLSMPAPTPLPPGRFAPRRSPPAAARCSAGGTALPSSAPRPCPQPLPPSGARGKAGGIPAGAGASGKGEVVWSFERGEREGDREGFPTRSPTIVINQETQETNHGFRNSTWRR